MRWYILQTLLHKELLRHLSNRGGLAMALLLIGAAMLLSFFGKRQVQQVSLVGGVLACYVDYWPDRNRPDEVKGLVEHLKENVPPDLARRIYFRPGNRVPWDRAANQPLYQPGAGGIQIVPRRGGDGGGQYEIVFRYRASPLEMAIYEDWFWKETRRHLEQRAAQQLGVRVPSPLANDSPLDDTDALWAYNEAQRRFREQVSAELARVSPGRDNTIPIIQSQRQRVTGQSQDIDLHTILASGLVLFALFFACVYLLPSMTCEERERGVLLAQALTPASPLEILAAKFLFYPGLGMLLAATLAGIYRPGVLLMPFFWLALWASASAFLGIGLTISSLARSQRAASLGAMCYLLAVALLLLICQINMIPYATNLSVENHTTLMMRGALAGLVAPWNWGNLIITILLAIFWCGLATYLFRKYGWQ